ncbi:MAG TPA: caspase family protein [Chitinophagaceae bacterium]|nr:caspase family protein [Chitinophagaceae bacterium]
MLLFAVLILCGSISFAQSFYEFHYHYKNPDGSDDNYKALVLRNADGTGIMRIVFPDEETKQNHIVEVTIQEEYGDYTDGSPDSTTLILIGIEEKHIVGKGEFSADHFVFELSDSGYFEPSYVLTFPEDSSENFIKGTIDNMRLLNDVDLSEDFVLQYFKKDEDFYKDLFETKTRSLDPKEKQTRLFLCLVANTNDKKIGKTCAVDLKNTLDTYKEVAEFLEIQFVPKVIEGAEFSKLNVDKAINAIRPAPNDIVVFYYTGHGFNEGRDAYRFPYLDLRDKTYQEYGGQYTMNMEAIYQKIKMKGARLNLVLSDCCNNDPSQSQNMTSEDPDTRVSSIGWDKNKCIALFMNSKRMSVLATAAQKGELSAGNISEGGFFTANFLQTLEKHIGKVRTTAKPLEPTWNSILNLSATETTTRAVRKWCRMPDDSVQKCTQHPVSKME